MNRGKKRALEQKAQLLLKDQEEDDTDEEDEVPLKKRPRRKRESGCDNNNTISLSLGSSSSSKNPNIEDLKQTDVIELVTTSKKPNEEEHEHTQLAVKEEDNIIDEDERERECDTAGLTLGSTSKKPNTEHHKDKSNDIDGEECQGGCDKIKGLRLGSTSSKEPNEEDRKLKHSQPEVADDETTELPPLKRYVRRIANNTSPSFNSSMSTEELPPVMSLPAVPVVAERESVSSSLTIVNMIDFHYLSLTWQDISK